MSGVLWEWSTDVNSKRARCRGLLGLSRIADIFGVVDYGVLPSYIFF